MSYSLDDLKWLQSDQAQILIQKLPSSVDPLALAKWAKDLPQEHRRALSEHLGLQKKVQAKFGLGRDILCDSLAYEQSTAADLSRWKSSLLPKDCKVWDLCCGMGADSFFVDQSICVYGVDLSPERLEMCRWNLQKARPKASNQLLQADVEHLPFRQMDYWFCDPDRRDGQRFGQWDTRSLRPSLEYIQSLWKKNAKGFIKLPPAAEMRADSFSGAMTVFAGDRKSCREQLLLPAMLLDTEPGTCAAVQVDTGDILLAPQTKALTSTHHAGRWLHEPSPTAIRSGLYTQIAYEYSLWAMDANIPYLFSEHPVVHPFLENYLILEETAYDHKNLQRTLQKFDIGEVIVKKRGIDIDPDSLSRKFSRKKGHTGILVITKDQLKVRCFLCAKYGSLLEEMHRNS